MNGSCKSKQKYFENVINLPFLDGQPYDLVLDILPIPQLHLLLGIVDKLLQLFEDRLFPCDKEAGRVLKTLGSRDPGS